MSPKTDALIQCLSADLPKVAPGAVVEVYFAALPKTVPTLKTSR
jgi:hypothetical protein